MKKLISVFGPSECKTGDSLFEQSVQLGSLLAQHNFIVVCGAYEGVMEGVAKGATEAGGRVIGVTAEVYYARGREANPYISKEVKVKSAIDRLMELLDLADGYIALGNSPGTLLEVTTAWEFARKRFLSPKPLLLLGEDWSMFNDLFLNARHFESYSQLAKHVPDNDSAIQALERVLGKQLDLPTLDIIQS